eukprot:TRINITY_DN1398_c0_g1_i3.p1 TRINITY_DN1398_c0_g1~~TRINITY_DN1398_c0_g1_i3.p1  ORF type:complete len:122 (-),score=1.79 TRINITY_DN1398_c0_g1_i3:966-1331(-)
MNTQIDMDFPQYTNLKQSRVGFFDGPKADNTLRRSRESVVDVGQVKSWASLFQSKQYMTEHPTIFTQPEVRSIPDPSKSSALKTLPKVGACKWRRSQILQKQGGSLSPLLLRRRRGVCSQY